MAERHVVVVGGGLTGLAVAHRLTVLSQKPGVERLRVTVLEASSAVGGAIRTERQDGFVIEAGADSFVVQKPQAAALCRELGLGDELIATREENRKVYVQRKGELHLLPEGVVLGVPTRIAPLIASPLVSWRGKLRMGLDLVMPRRAGDEDESLGELVRRRFGAEALACFGEPILGGVYTGDIEALSAKATFPQLVGYEAKHGSLIRGALAQRRSAGVKSGKPPSAFASLRGGMGELVRVLAERATRNGCEIRTGVSVRSIDRQAGGSACYAIQARGPGDREETIAASDVVLTSYAYAAGDAVRAIDGRIADILTAIPYLSTATVSLAFDRADIAHPLDASGVVIPKGEARRILAASFSSSKWPHRAPSGTALLRVFFGGHRDPIAAEASDETLEALAREELASLLGITKPPRFARVFRYPRARPQPLVGHGARIREVCDRAAAYPGLYFAGAAIDGVGIPDCVRQADQVAAQIVASIAPQRLDDGALE